MSETYMDSVHEWPVLRPIEMLFENDCVEWFYVFGETGEEVICVTTNDKVYAFGKNCDGVLGLGHNNAVNEPTIVDELWGKDIDSIVSNSYSKGNCFALALNKSGKIYSWGSNQFGCLGNGGVNCSYKPELITALKEIKVIDICCGLHHCLALTQTGDVYAWGRNANGECGTGDNISPQMTPIKVTNLDNIKMTAIACGGHHSLALTETGVVYIKMTGIACGGHHSLALTETGVVYGWGFNKNGELGIGNLTNQSTPIEPTLIDVIITKIRAGLHHSLLLSSNGEVYGFGDNSDGQVAHMSEERYSLPRNVSYLNKMADIEAVPQRNISMAVSVFKKCFVWGVNGQYVPFEVHQKSLNKTHRVYTEVNITIKPVKPVKSLFWGHQNENKKCMINKHKIMFNNSDYSDIKFKIDGKYIYAQKLYLRANCKHFDHMFADNRWLESGAEEIEISEYSYDAYYSFISYLYDGVISTRFEAEPIETLVQLLELADAYVEENLKDKCVDFLNIMVNEHNVCYLYSIAVEYDSQKLQDYCLDYAADKLNLVCLTDGYLEMCADDKIAGKMFRKYFAKENTYPSLTSFDSDSD